MEGIIVVLAVLGALDSLYTALQQRFPKLFQYCFTPSLERMDCYEVLHSKYARLFLIPNSWLGVIAYALLALIYWNAPKFLVVGADRLYIVGAALATVGLAASLYLLYVQAKVLKKYCIFCLTSTALMTVIAILSWLLV